MPEIVYPTNYLDEITRCAKGRAMYDILLVQTIQKARDNEISWERIGMALGVSRQAATQRYQKLVEEAPPLAAKPRKEDDWAEADG